MQCWWRQLLLDEHSSGMKRRNSVLRRQQDAGSATASSHDARLPDSTAGVGGTMEEAR